MYDYIIETIYHISYLFIKTNQTTKARYKNSNTPLNGHNFYEFDELFNEKTSKGGISV